jgi:hypothetical protein
MIDTAEVGARALDSAAVVMVGRQGRIEYWSTGACTLSGYDADAMVGEKVTAIIPEEFRARHWAGWGKAWRENGFAVARQSRSRCCVPTATSGISPVASSLATLPTANCLPSLLAGRPPRGRMPRWGR